MQTFIWFTCVVSEYNCALRHWSAKAQIRPRIHAFRSETSLKALCSLSLTIGCGCTRYISCLMKRTLIQLRVLIPLKNSEIESLLTKTHEMECSHRFLNYHCYQHGCDSVMAWHRHGYDFPSTFCIHLKTYYSSPDCRDVMSRAFFSPNMVSNKVNKQLLQSKMGFVVKLDLIQSIAKSLQYVICNQRSEGPDTLADTRSLTRAVIFYMRNWWTFVVYLE